MDHPLIEITKWPSMPAPMHSRDAGEAWIWGDFFATLQKDPMTVAHALKSMTGGDPKEVGGMSYPYAMSVFYRRTANPHGPSSRPVLAVCVEQADFSALARMLGGNSDLADALPQAGKGPLMIGVFSGEGRSNLGELSEILELNSIRAKFFEIIQQQLNPGGSPQHIGPISAVYGHPQTGVPAESRVASRSGKGGCMSTIVMLLLFVGVAGVLLWG